MPSDTQKLVIHTSALPEAALEQKPKHRHILIKTRLSFQERLLRNSCLACAVLLGILALGNVNHPWAKQASDRIEQALTMEIDLDQSLGQLSFVQKLMPESALVFFNLSGSSELTRPVQGELTHSYSPNQPWLMFDCAAESAVCACAEGTVSAVSELSDGGFGVMIDHGNGMESVTACLLSADVKNGDRISRGAVIGTASDRLYFELQLAGQPTDPTEKLGL